MKYDLTPFEERVEKGYLRKVYDGDLVLYNYTDQCTYDKAWDEYTIQARGIIFNHKTGEIVARPFPKFFNIEEHYSTQLKSLPNEPFVAFEKMDGSLGIIYNYEGKWRVATRGSFTSDQAIRAAEILEKQIVYERLSPAFTYLAEIIYPENKIIVNYGNQENLTILGIIETTTGRDIRINDNNTKYLTDVGFKLPQIYDLSLEQILANKQTISKNEEGYVLLFKSGLRVKVKGEEYLKIAKIKAHLSPLSFWEVMVDGKVPAEYLAVIPEEILPEYLPIIDALETKYNTLWWEINVQYNQLNITPEHTRKDIALKFKNHIHEHPFFAILDHKPIDKFIMKLIRPDGNNLL